MSVTTYDTELDTSGLKCPMPVVKARKAAHSMEAGEVLKVISTDRGSLKDFEGWTKVDKQVELLAQETEEGADGELYIHFVKRVA